MLYEIIFKNPNLREVPNSIDNLENSLKHLCIINREIFERIIPDKTFEEISM